MIEIEVQNETHQTQQRLRFAAVPRIGEGLRLREPDGIWASYDVLDVWYQKAEYGDIWMPYIHVCMTPAAEEPVEEVHETHEEPAFAGVAFNGNPFREETFDDDSFDEDALHEDDAHDLHSEDAFASLAREVQPSNI